MNIKVRTTRNGWTGKCPMPNHDGDANNENAFTIQPDTGLWSCWSHQCHGEYGRDLISLIRTFYQISFKGACDLILKICDSEETPTMSNDEYNDVSNLLLSDYEIQMDGVPEALLKQIAPRYDYMLARGFTEEVLADNEVGYYEGHDESSFMRQRIIFPLRDFDGVLVGFNGRTVIDNVDVRKLKGIKKWMISNSLQINGHLSISNLLYNANKAREVVRRGALILVEGTIDALKLKMAGFENVCAVFGSNLSRQQEITIRQMGVRVLVPLFDGDAAGDSLRRKVNARFEKDIIQVENVELEKGKDPGELSVEEVKGLLHDFIVQ